MLICHLWWWNPLHYNTRQCFRETEGRFYVIPQRYWLPRDKDKIMQPWTTSDWYIDQHGDFNGDVGKGSNREPYIQAIRAKIKDLLF